MCGLELPHAQVQSRDVGEKKKGQQDDDEAAHDVVMSSLGHAHKIPKRNHTITASDVVPSMHASDATICAQNCRCEITLVCDNLFFEGPDGRQDASYAISTMVGRMAVVNGIYTSTPFNGASNYGFLIKTAIVYNSTGGGNPVSCDQCLMPCHAMPILLTDAWRLVHRPELPPGVH